MAQKKEDELIVTSANDLIGLAKEMTNKWGVEVWWRGQPNHDWIITPTAHRQSGGLEREKNMAIRFIQKAPTRHSPCPANNDLPGWLFFMQHYGLPTRLLDWTGSILTAAYFAVETHDQNDGAIFGLNPFLLNKTLSGIDALLNPINVKNLFDAPFTDKNTDENKIAAVLTKEIDLRMTVQLSQFTIHGDGASLEDHLESEFVSKTRIPADKKEALRTQLIALGIRRSNLFPDAENLAREIKGYKYD